MKEFKKHRNVLCTSQYYVKGTYQKGNLEAKQADSEHPVSYDIPVLNPDKDLSFILAFRFQLAELETKMAWRQNFFENLCESWRSLSRSWLLELSFKRDSFKIYLYKNYL